MGWVDPYLCLWLCRHSHFSQRVLAGVAREAIRTNQRRRDSAQVAESAGSKTESGLQNH